MAPETRIAELKRQLNETSVPDEQVSLLHDLVDLLEEGPTRARAQVIEEARRLVVSGEQKVNPEYSRGMAELIGNLFPAEGDNVTRATLVAFAEFHDSTPEEALDILY
jgi:hypothetical protein